LPTSSRRSRAISPSARRLTSLSNGCEPDDLELFEQRGRVRADPSLREHRDRPLALGLADRARGRRVDHRHVIDRHQEQRSAQREHAQDAPLLVEPLLDGGRR
jgi:hypothetical protein